MNKPRDLTELLTKGPLIQAAEVICKENKLLYVEAEFWERKYDELKIKFDILSLSIGDDKPTVANYETVKHKSNS